MLSFGRFLVEAFLTTAVIQQIIDSGDYLFHGTDECFLGSIAKNGLKSRTYFTEQWDEAVGVGGNVVVVRKDVVAMKESPTGIGHHWVSTKSIDAAKIHAIIPESKIRELPDKFWKDTLPTD